MNFRNLKEHVADQITALSISGIIIVSFYMIMNNLGPIFAFFADFFSAAAPFLIGIFLSFVLAPLRNLIEDKLFERLNWPKKRKRLVAVIISIMVFILLLAIILMILMPQLISSIRTLVSSLGTYVQTIQSFLGHLEINDANLIQNINTMLDNMVAIVTNWLIGAEGGLGKVLGFSIQFGRGILNFLIGIIICMYFLLDQDRFIMQALKLNYGIFDKRIADSLVYFFRLNATMFHSFLFGKALDSLIIGVICYIGCLILQMPYSPLIAVVIGVTNMIPVFGPFLGAIPCGIILLMISPIQSLVFVIFILVLQQFDGNLLGPYILGDSLGLPTLWVMFAIIMGGAFAGLPGMFLGVPVFSAIYVLIRDTVYNRLADKNIVIENRQDT